ncbi:amino-acid permease [Apiospora marii]|uniref:Amino-acid permease n=1 Tax=Apiospora marii TaxID=335849 RepID=A0ABR1SHC4_9PEZI
MGISRFHRSNGRTPAPPNVDVTSIVESPISGHTFDEAHGDLHREMKPRQLRLILGTGSALAHGGPASLLIAYLVMGFVVYIVMVALGEMGAFLPHKKSFSGYASRFIDPAVGFATGWNYFFKYAIAIPNNLTATGILLQFWRPDINISVWIVVFGACIIILNLIHVSIFGEVEFWMSLVKALVIVMCILLCLIIALGGGPNHSRTGFYYWQTPGAFAEYLADGSLGRFLGVWASIVQATFAYMGTELVGVAFGETPDPRKNVPRAVRQTLLRICFFYIAGVLVLGMSVPYTSKALLEATKGKATGGKQGSIPSASPFVVAASSAGITGLGDAVNALLLVFTISAANSDIYLASRSAWALAKDDQAPRVFQRTSARGVPIAAVALASCFIALGFMNVAKSAATVFGYFVSLVTIFGLLNWVSVLASYLAMQRGMVTQKIPRHSMPYRNPLLPWGAYVALFLVLVVMVFNGFAAFMPTFQVDKFVTSYVGIPVFVINVVWWKMFKKTKLVTPKTMDLDSGRRK